MTLIQITDIKQFMKHILVNDIFDKFYVHKMEIASFCNFSIDGNLNNDFYTIKEKEDIAGRKNILWSEIKPFALQIIKGNKSPLSMHIVLMPDTEMLNDIIKKCSGRAAGEDINGVFLNIKFYNKELSLITGTSRKSFTLDKVLDDIWEEEVKNFLKYYKIS